MYEIQGLKGPLIHDIQGFTGSLIYDIWGHDIWEIRGHGNRALADLLLF